ncbi:hypothetical protein QBC43DRAFT_307005 [Cladorrhinum sp. PSN259]|nr:hypothetical protein QBC43DRAFT_307005 [Cladorrhinum sp. PSN259]
MPEAVPWYQPGGDTASSNLDHDDKSPDLLAGMWTTFGIATLFVLLRLWTRARIIRRLGPADLMITLSLICSAGMCVAMVYEVKHGMGKHVYDIDLAVHLSPMMKGFWFSLLFYILTLAFTKVSICLLYINVFTLEWARWGAWAVLAVVVIHNVWAVCTCLTMCIPLRATWDSSIQGARCHSDAVWWANTGLTIATDVLIFVLPIPIIGPLKLPRRQKIVVVGIFALGFFICTVSLTRLVILIRSKNNPDPDTTYNNNSLNHLTSVEVHTAIVVSCLMTLKPLAARFFPDLLTPRDPATSATGLSAEARNGSNGNVEPQLTIGSRPVRVLPGQNKNKSGMDGWIEAARAAAVGGGGGGRSLKEGDGMEEVVVLGDIEAGDHGHDGHGGLHEKRIRKVQDEEKGGEHVPEVEEVMRSDRVAELQRPLPPAPPPNHHAFIGRGDSASVRTEQELGPEVCARSLG